MVLINRGAVSRSRCGRKRTVMGPRPSLIRAPFGVNVGYYFAPRIASLAALATRNLTTRLAAILMVSPVAGLRPMRALRFTNTNLPKPGSVKVFLAFL